MTDLNISSDSILNKKYKIVCLIHSLAHKGGMQRVAVTLANYWASEGHQVSILTIHPAPCFYEINKNIEVVCLVNSEVSTSNHSNLPQAFSNLLKLKSAITNYIKFLKLHKPDIVLIHRGAVYDSLFGFQRFYSNRTLELLHLPFHLKEEKPTPLHKKLYNFLCLKLQAKNNLVVLNKHEQEDVLKAGWRDVSCIFNAVPIKSSKKADGDAKYFLTIGRNVPQKGLDVLIKAFSLIAHKYKDWNLRIIGEDVTHPVLGLRGLINDYNLSDQVELLEPVKNISDYYLSSSVYVLSSYFEGMPMVVLEAMEFGLPIITSDINGIDDLVSDQCSIKFETGNDAKLSFAMQYMIDNIEVRKKMGHASSEWVKNFYIENINKNWMKVIADTINKDKTSNNKAD